VTAARPTESADGTSSPNPSKPSLLDRYRVAGEASAAAIEVLPAHEIEADPTAAAFFDIDNTIMRGASIFHLARGLARRRFFTIPEVTDFAWKQVKFLASGAEDMDDMASATESALGFVAGRRVSEIVELGTEIFDEIMVDKMWPGTLAIAQAHIDAGQRVWLVTAAPVELATIVARRLGLTGALGTVSEIRDGVYTGKLVGHPLHGPAKAEAVRALAARAGLDLDRCAAYSDSFNDLPMLTLVGDPCAVNPDSALRAYARDHDWPIRDFRRQRMAVRVGIPAAVVATGALAAGVAIGVTVARRGSRAS